MYPKPVYHRQLLLYVKFKIGKDFPGNVFPASVVAKKGELTGKTELDPEKNKAEAVIVFPRGAAATAEAIEISITGKDKAAVGKLKLENNGEWNQTSQTAEAALSSYPFTTDTGGGQKPERLLLGVWLGEEAHPAYGEAVRVNNPAAAAVNVKIHPSLSPKEQDHPKLAYYQLTVLPFVTNDPEKMNQKYMHFYLVATVGNQTVQTPTYSSLPTLGNDKDPLLDFTKLPTTFWFVKVNGTPPDSVKLVLKLMAYLPTEESGKNSGPKAVGTVEKQLNAMASNTFEPVKVTTGEDKKDTGVGVRVKKSQDLTGYHVFDEQLDRSSSLSATGVSGRELAKRMIGSLEVRIVGARGAVAAGKKGGKGAEVYCVARYESKWNQTATFVDRPTPGPGNEFSWNVYEISTVLTVGLFENCQLSAPSGDDKKKEPAEDKPMGRVSIPLNSLSTNRTYKSKYFFRARQPDGSLKDTGMLELEYGFSGRLLPSVLQYFRPPLPGPHYTDPIPESVVKWLRPFAAEMVAEELAKKTPPLTKKVVEYMYGTSEEDRRRRKQEEANRESLWLLGDKAYWALEETFSWRNPKQMTWVLCFLISAIAFPELVLPTIFIILAAIPMMAYFDRPKPKRGFVQVVEVITERAEPEQATNASYEVLRKKALEYEKLLDKCATKAESLQALLSWRNPLATAAIMVLCAVAVLLLCFVSFQTAATILVLCVFLYPLFEQPQQHGGIPLLNFLRRVPGLNDNDKTIT